MSKMRICDEGGYMISVDASAAISGRVLVVEYRVGNDSGETVFLENRLLDWYGMADVSGTDRGSYGARRPSAAVAHIFYGGGDLCRLVQARPGIPTDVFINEPRVPFAVRLQSGHTEEAAIRLKLPLREWHAHEPPHEEPCPKTKVERIQLEIEYFRQEDIDSAEELENHPGIWRVRGSPEGLLVKVLDLQQACLLWRWAK